MRNWLETIRTFVKKNKKTIILITVLNYSIKIAIVLILLLKGKESKAQSTNALIREGNSLYKEQKYNQATEKYANALQKEPNNSIAIFNQAAAMYQLGEYEKAETYFEGLSKQYKNSELVSKSLHNLGNSFYKKEDYEKSVTAYKHALKINPKDADTKYNLMMALNKLNKNSQDNQQQQNQQDKNKQQQNNNQQPQHKDQPSSSKQQQEQQQKQGMSQEEANRLLEALGNEENKTQQKLGHQKGEPQKVKIKKDW